tara:strand:+ start:802 stop:1836 length:1035 start_codon:yes stop_codon:yes gene_type:complete
MASKNIHHSEINPELLDDLGFTDAVAVGLMTSNLGIEDVQLSESVVQYNKVRNLLSLETTNDLTTVKRAFVLPMHNVSTDRLKAALKEHKISVTNDYEKADFIIPHTNFYDTYTGIENMPQSKLMFKLTNGYYSNDHRDSVRDYFEKHGNNVILEKRALGDRYQHNIDYESAPYDSYVFSNMSLALADLIDRGHLEVIETDTILNQSANRVPMTKELMEDITKMIDGYSVSDEEYEMAGKIIPTIDPTGEPYLLYNYADLLNRNSYHYNRNKDVMYWLDKHDIYRLSSMNAEEAIQYFEEKDQLDSRCFRALEVKCREQIQINNRELYTFKVQVKPEYRKYMQD